MERWKARVERVQWRTGGVSWGCRGEGKGWGEAGMLTEEHVLDNYGLLRELVEDVVRSGETLLLYARPREVDVEEEEQDAEADDGRLGTVSL